MSKPVTLADTCYFEAMRLMASGHLSAVVLWQRKAFDRYREALVDGKPNHGWMRQFILDFVATIGSLHSASFLNPDHESYPAELKSEVGPVAVIRLIMDDRTSLIIVRPEADQVLTPVNPRF